MNLLRNRAKEHFPTVLLTLLSIVQALALELLWSHITDTAYLLEMHWIAGLSWLQLAITLTSLILIWVVYASNVMRFRWTPTTSDSVYPFVIGLVEFSLIESLGVNEVGQWFMLLGIAFALMTWVSHKNMRSARQDPDNQAFFASREPAQLKDFSAQIGVVLYFVISGAALLVVINSLWLMAFLLGITACIMAVQFYSSAMFWSQSMNEQGA